MTMNTQKSHKDLSTPYLTIGESALASYQTDNKLHHRNSTSSGSAFFNQRNFHIKSMKELNVNRNNRIEELKNKYNINRFIVSPANKHRSYIK